MNFISLNEIINIFGIKDKLISEENLNIIIEELESISDSDTHIELAKKSIELGKNQILEYILKNNNFNKNQINILKQHVKQFESNDKIKDKTNYELIMNCHKKKIWE